MDETTRSQLAEKIADLINHGLNNEEILKRLMLAGSEGHLLLGRLIKREDLIDIIRHLMEDKRELTYEYARDTETKPLRVTATSYEEAAINAITDGGLSIDDVLEHYGIRDLRAIDHEG